MHDTSRRPRGHFRPACGVPHAIIRPYPGAATMPTRPQSAALPRCGWAQHPADARMQRYHDTEWGVPQHDDRALFELLILEGAQAGLSWPSATTTGGRSTASTPPGSRATPRARWPR